MRRFVAFAAVLLAAGFTAAGCGRGTAVNGGPPPSRPVVSRPAMAAPFSQLKVGPLYTVDFVSDKVGYVGGRALILKSTDQGRSWRNVYTGLSNVLAVDAVDATDVWAATKDHLLHSTDGLHFTRLNLPALDSIGPDGKGISALDFVSRDQGFVLARGTVWRLTGRVLEKATPPAAVDSLCFVDARIGFAAGGNRVYKTTGGGRTWRKVFTAPVKTGKYPWRAVIHASSAQNAWLLLTAEDAMMSQQAYALFHMEGGRFIPEMKEGNFKTLYPTLHVAQKHMDLGGYPGPFAVFGARDAFFAGWFPDQLLLTRTVDDGQTFTSYLVGHSDDPGVFAKGISFPDATHGWLVGSDLQGRGFILFTTDGRHFEPVP